MAPHPLQTKAFDICDAIGGGMLFIRQANAVTEASALLYLQSSAIDSVEIRS